MLFYSLSVIKNNVFLDKYRQKKLINKLTKMTQDKYLQESDNYWLRGFIQGIPVLGGTLDTWFFQFAEKEKQKRIESSLKKFTEKLKILEKKIDFNYIEENIEEYAFLFEKFMRYVSLEYRKKMRKAFVNLMSNLSIKTYSDRQNKDVYLSKLSELTPEHLAMLQMVYDFTNIKTKPDFEKAKKVKGYIVQEFIKKNLEEALIHAIFTDLQSKGLINRVFHNTFGGGLYSYHVTKLGETMLKLVN